LADWITEGIYINSYSKKKLVISLRLQTHILLQPMKLSMILPVWHIY